MFVGWAAMGGVAVVIGAMMVSLWMGMLLEVVCEERGEVGERHSQVNETDGLVSNETDGLVSNETDGLV